MNAEQQIRELVTAAGSLAETTSIFYKAFQDAGFDKAQAFHLATDVMKKILDQTYKSSGPRDENE